MSGPHPTPAEQHLGDRLAALVDGELGHDARERVLAHLATCTKCKAEADAQRRLKNVFAEAAPPPPSESFLARLQGLPGGDDSDDPFGGGGLSGGGVFSMTAPHALNPLRPRSRNPFTLDAPDTPVPRLPDAEHGFRIHEVGRQEPERSASRSRRFAFAAAGAVSLAAIALGGVSAGAPTAGSGGQGGAPSNATPLSASGPATSADAGRRRSAAQSVTRSSERPAGGLPASAPITASAPLLPGVPTPPGPPAPEVPAPMLGAVGPLTALPTESYGPESAMPPEASPEPASGLVAQPTSSLLDPAPKNGGGIRTVR